MTTLIILCLFLVYFIYSNIFNMCRINNILYNHPELEIEDYQFSLWNYMVNSVKNNYQTKVSIATTTGNISYEDQSDSITNSSNDNEEIQTEIKENVSNHISGDIIFDSDYDTTINTPTIRSSSSSDYIYKEHYFTKPIYGNIDLREAFEENFKRKCRIVDPDKQKFSVKKSDIAILMNCYNEINSTKKYEGYYMVIKDKYYLTQTGIKYINSLINNDNVYNDIKEGCLIFTDYTLENSA